MLVKGLVLGVFLIPVVGYDCFSQSVQTKPAQHDTRAHIAGTWRGNSVCAVENSPCHDEVNVYRFSEIAKKPGWFSGSAAKIVNGKEIDMGTTEWKYDSEKHILEGATPGGTIRLTVDDNKMEGTFTLRNNTLYRRIYLKKES